MHIEQTESGALRVRRRTGSPTDARIHRDSTLMYQIARELNRRCGLDVIRKDASKDGGNLTSEGNYYVVDRKRRFAWHHAEYQIDFAYSQYNTGPPCWLYLQPLGDVPRLALVREST